MKKVLAIAVLLLVVTAGMALASASNWMIYVQASDPVGNNAGVYNQIGVKPATADLIDSSDLAYDYGTGGTTVKVASQQIGSTTSTLYARNFMSSASYTTYPAQQKIWKFHVSGLADADTGSGIMLRFRTATATVVQNVAAPALNNPWGWYIRLANRQGMAVQKPAWAGGGAWTDAEEWVPLAIPTTTNTYFAQIDLPVVTTSVSDAAHVSAEGYEFEFMQGAVPEPASLMILGTGLAGLVGLVTRRRK